MMARSRPDDQNRYAVRGTVIRLTIILSRPGHLRVGTPARPYGSESS